MGSDQNLWFWISNQGNEAAKSRIKATTEGNHEGHEWTRRPGAENPRQDSRRGAEAQRAVRMKATRRRWSAKRKCLLRQPTALRTSCMRILVARARSAYIFSYPLHTPGATWCANTSFLNSIRRVSRFPVKEHGSPIAAQILNCLLNCGYGSCDITASCFQTDRESHHLPRGGALRLHRPHHVGRLVRIRQTGRAG